jgi:SAM-dependent methyltransferase
MDPQPDVDLQKRLINSSTLYDSLRSDEEGMEIRRAVLEYVERFAKPPGRLLQIGCSRGYLLAAANRSGWQTTGIEFSKKWAEYGRNHLGLDIIESWLDGNSFDLRLAGKFDVIVMWHILEHVNNPKAFLEGVATYLKDTGILVIQVPDFGKLGETIVGWYHLSYFTKDTLERLLTYNYSVIDIGYDDVNNFISMVVMKSSATPDEHVQGPPKASSISTKDWFVGTIGSRPHDLFLYRSSGRGNTLIPSGNIGIGTHGPYGKLHAYDSATDVIIRAEAGSDSKGAYFQTLASSHWSGCGIFGSSSEHWFIGMRGTDDLHLYRSGGGGNIAVPFGNMGIGTVSPIDRLHVDGNIRATALITRDVVFENSFSITRDKLGLAFKNDLGEEVARLDAQGNLHIKGEIIKDL